MHNKYMLCICAYRKEKNVKDYITNTILVIIYLYYLNMLQYQPNTYHNCKN